MGPGQHGGGNPGWGSVTAPIRQYSAPQQPPMGVQYAGQPPLYQGEQVWKDPNERPATGVGVQEQRLEMRHELHTS